MAVRPRMMWDELRCHCWNMSRLVGLLTSVGTDMSGQNKPKGNAEGNARSPLKSRYIWYNKERACVCDSVCQLSFNRSNIPIQRPRVRVACCALMLARALQCLRNTECFLSILAGLLEGKFIIGHVFSPLFVVWRSTDSFVIVF